MYLSLFLSSSLSIYIYISTDIFYIYIYIYVYVYAFIYICIHIHISLYEYIYIYIDILYICLLFRTWYIWFALQKLCVKGLGRSSRTPRDFEPRSRGVEGNLGFRVIQGLGKSMFQDYLGFRVVQGLQGFRGFRLKVRLQRLPGLQFHNWVLGLRLCAGFRSLG